MMPFLWNLMATGGSIAGDQTVGSTVQLRNQLWFSYPGYAEILLGEPHDDTLKSNDPVRNPYTTVLERIREALNLPREYASRRSMIESSCSSPRVRSQ